MAKPIAASRESDSMELQALFDTIAAEANTGTPVPAAEPAADDSDDLEALFDSVAATVAPSTSSADAPPEAGPQKDVVFNRLGLLARQLHDTMRELGYDKVIEKSARQIPDTQQRLSYIAQMTEQAASRVLNATDVARPIQDALLAKAEDLGPRWERLFGNQLSLAEFKSLATDTRELFRELPEQVRTTNAQLLEIMMAQDFQDLTGQVIKKVADMAQMLESELLRVLIEAIPEERRTGTTTGLMNGPVVSSSGRTDVVTSQSQVDDLLDSLGF